MLVSKTKELFYKEIFPKVKYDKTLKQYKISLIDYITLKLNKKQFRLLEKICNQNNIFLEKLPELLSLKETEKLFTRLKYLKDNIDKLSNDSDKEIYNQEIFKIRTTLFEGHQQLLYRIIIMNIPDLDESNYKEDIIQSGYIYLLRAIDNYNIQKGLTFRQYIFNYASNNILRDSVCPQKGMRINKELNLVIKTREKIQNQNIENITYKELSKETGIEESRIKELIVLEQLLNSDSIESILETEEETLQPVDNEMEEQVHQNLLRELLILIIETLPNINQQQVILMSYGFNGEIPLNDVQISERLGMFRQRTHQHKEDALNIIKNSARIKYIKELVEGYTQIELPKDFSIPEIDKDDLLYEKLELFLLKHLPQEELIDLLSNLDDKHYKALSYYFELTEQKQISTSEKIKELGIGSATYMKRRREGLVKIRRLIEEKYVKNNPNENIKDSLDYLMYNYLNKSIPKTKKRNRV